MTTITYSVFVFWLVLCYLLGSVVTFCFVYPWRGSHGAPVVRYRPKRPMRNSELMQAHGDNVAKSKPEFAKGQAAFEKQRGKV